MNFARERRKENGMNAKRGRPRKAVNRDAFKQEKDAFKAREITAEQAAKNMGIGRATFFRMLKEEQAGTVA